MISFTIRYDIFHGIRTYINPCPCVLCMYGRCVDMFYFCHAIHMAKAPILFSKTCQIKINCIIPIYMGKHVYIYIRTYTPVCVYVIAT